jgi:hypothetical protein
MRTAHQKERPQGGEVETETGERLKGPKPLNVPKENTRVLSKGSPGEDRTPDQPIGQVAHMKGNDKQGGTGQPQTSNLEPEKQGGIGGP